MTKFLISLLFVLSVTLNICKAQPETKDYVIGYGGLTLALGGELFLKKGLAAETAAIAAPGAFDRSFRDVLKWESDNMVTAGKISDYLIFAVTLPSILWTPLTTNKNYSAVILTQAEVLAATSIVTNIVKLTIRRKRPLAYFKSRESLGELDNLSFFSGHSSFSFAIATSTAYLLARSNPEYSALIWTTSMTVATLTAYLRVAGDFHYFTDVLVGAIVGGAIGYFIPSAQYDCFFKDKSNAPDKEVRFNFSIPL